MKHVILGNGAAAITAAEKLRELKPEDEIAIITREDTTVYSKCMLPDYVGGRMSREKLFIRPMDVYDRNRLKLILNSNVESVDFNNRKVNLSDGQSVDFDKLLISIGGNPFLPPVEGLRDAQYYSINSVRDADTIIQKALEGGKAVVMGGGLTGIEMSFALARLGMEVTLVEREPKLLPLQLTAESSKVMAKYLEKEGITVMTGATVSKVGSERGKHVELSDGSIIPYDMLLVAVGTRPNLDLIKDSGIECNRGILVDEYLKSSAPDIFAAGDVAEAVNRLSNEYVTSYIWPNAIAQGKCAAYNMAGVCQPFSDISVMQNMVQMRDMPFTSMGLVNPKGEEYEVLMLNDFENGIYKKLVLKDNKLKGMILIGDVKKANTLGSLIRKETDVSDIKHTLVN